MTIRAPEPSIARIPSNIVFCRGDLFASGAQALVNTVNCRGVMGAGLARQFKDRFPAMFADYRASCAAGRIEPGVPTLWLNPDGPHVINFPTKDHWRDPSRLEWIADGLTHLRALLSDHQLESVAVPPLGCGLGGLAWPAVRPLIVTSLAGLGTRVCIYGAPPAP